MRVGKWGNSLAIRLPASVIEVLEIEEGDEIEIFVEDQRGFRVAKSPERRAILARLRQYRGALPEDFHFDRVEAHEAG